MVASCCFLSPYHKHLVPFLRLLGGAKGTETGAVQTAAVQNRWEESSEQLAPGGRQRLR